MELTIKLSKDEVQVAIDTYLKARNLNFTLTKISVTQDGEVLADCTEFKPIPQRSL